MANNNLRAEGEKINYTPAMIKEYVKCKQDIIHFAENYFKIVTIDDGEIHIKLHEYQKRMLKAFVEEDEERRHIVVVSSRQIGKCVFDTKIRVKNKKTGEIKEILIDEFFEKIKSNISDMPSI